jgi:transposase
MAKALENMTFEELLEINKKQESLINEMQFQIDQFKRLLFGAKRERFVQDHEENQMTLPFEVEQEEAPEKEQEVIT